ncbi:glycosyltransferase family 4 protein [Candidatus Marinimicrobia bacterium]|nr:glycosyltransferase family 4 protein [Candidatus Neomarinimicrobiota bacterium]
MQSATFEIGNFFNENNWNATIITNRYPRTLNSYEIINGLRVNRYTFLANPFHYVRSGRIDLFFAWLFFKPVTLIRLIIDFNRIKPTIVNLHFPDHQLLECYLLMLLFRFKLIISLHGNEVERMRTLSKRSIKHYLYNKLFTSAVNITGCSKYLINKLIYIYPDIGSERCMHLYNGVNKHFIDQHITKLKNNVIFAAGRFEPIKGFDLLIDAFNSQHGLQLFIAGGEKRELLNLGLEIKEGISIIGKLSAKEIAAHMSESKITVIPSRMDSYGIAVAEALCCGSPVVATNVGGIPEVVALATEKLSPIEKEIFNRWVKLVEPNISAIKNGIDTIIKNGASIEHYLLLVSKLRSQFHWPLRLNKYQSVLESKIYFS